MSTNRELIKANWHLATKSEAEFYDVFAYDVHETEITEVSKWFYLYGFQNARMNGSDVVLYHAKGVREFPIAGFNNTNQELIDTIDNLIGQEAAEHAYRSGYDVFVVVPDTESSKVHIWDISAIAPVAHTGPNPVHFAVVQNGRVGILCGIGNQSDLMTPHQEGVTCKLCLEKLNPKSAREKFDALIDGIVRDVADTLTPLPEDHDPDESEINNAIDAVLAIPGVHDLIQENVLDWVVYMLGEELVNRQTTPGEIIGDALYRNLTEEQNEAINNLTRDKGETHNAILR